MEEESYVSAPVPAIIENIDDATIPVERDSDLTDEQKDAKAGADGPYARRRRPSSLLSEECLRTAREKI